MYSVKRGTTGRTRVETNDSENNPIFWEPSWQGSRYSVTHRCDPECSLSKVYWHTVNFSSKDNFFALVTVSV